MLYIQEQFVNKTRGGRYGDSDIYETFTDDLGELFRSLQKEHGRCTGKMYVDRTDGATIQAGWVFEKRAEYDDCAETFLQETWATVHSAPPSRMIKHHYHPFNS